VKESCGVKVAVKVGIKGRGSRSLVWPVLPVSSIVSLSISEAVSAVRSRSGPRPDGVDSIRPSPGAPPPPTSWTASPTPPVRPPLPGGILSVIVGWAAPDRVAAVVVYAACADGLRAVAGQLTRAWVPIPVKWIRRSPWPDG
jgi:hypothetical protein